VIVFFHAILSNHLFFKSENFISNDFYFEDMNREQDYMNFQHNI
jgi:hypothetical protein